MHSDHECSAIIQQNRELRKRQKKYKQEIEKLNQIIQQLQYQLDLERKNKPILQNIPIMQTQQYFQTDSDDYSQQLQQENTTQLSDQSLSQSSPQKIPAPEINSFSSNLSYHQYQDINTSYSKKIINFQQHTPPQKTFKNLLESNNQKKYQNNSMTILPFQSKQHPLSTKNIYIGNQIKKQTNIFKSQKFLFKKISNDKSIFQSFFITGIHKGKPCISYGYPSTTIQNLQGYLGLIYGQNYLRQPELSPSNSTKSKINLQFGKQHNLRKQSFVIPIIKSQGKSCQKDYLILFQVQQTVIDRSDKQSINCIFPRYYCFLTQWKLFNQFGKLTTKIINYLSTARNKTMLLDQPGFSKIARETLQQPLEFFSKYTTDYNKTMDCTFNKDLSFSADLPPIQNCYQLTQKYIQNHSLTTNVYIKNGDEELIETKLIGILLTYVFLETKVVLFSTNKVRVSDCVLEFMQLIKPFTYVNPIIMSPIKDQYETYLDAPMGLILGLWVQNRRSNKQKIQIFMNKKSNLLGLIEKAMLKVPDGIVINLDTGLIFGGKIDKKLNNLSKKINNLPHLMKANKNIREQYKLVQKLMFSKTQSQQVKYIWKQWFTEIQKTQLYSYYLQNKQQ